MSLQQIVEHTRPHTLGIMHLKAARNVKRRRETILRTFDLRSPEWFVLGMVADQPDGITTKELANCLEVKSTYITAVVRSLKERGWLAITQHGTDSRFRPIILTPTGRTFVLRVEQALSAALIGGLQGVSAEEMKHYLKVLTVFARP